MRYKKIALVVGLLLSITKVVCAEESSYTKEQLRSELEWSGRNCKKPSISTPKQIGTFSYDEYIKTTNTKNYKPKFVYWRRWIDIDGDGICEIFDVNMPEQAILTKRFYGYTTTINKFENHHWKKERTEGGWFPLILRDKKHKRVYSLTSPFLGEKDGYYAATEYYPGINWGKIYEGSDVDICETFRRNIALAYMLTFEPPSELKTDDLMSEKWNGGNEVFAVFNGLSAVKKQADTLACIKPYLKIAAEIDHRIRELYPTYFSGPHGLK